MRKGGEFFMFRKKDWKMSFILVLVLVLAGGYYQQLSVEMKTMLLPLVIIIGVGIVVARIKQMEYEIRSAKVNAKEVIVQSFSLIDKKGRQRVSISTDVASALLTVFDADQHPCVLLDVLNENPALKLVGPKGSALIDFDEQGRPNFVLIDDKDEKIWSAL
jgi:hypothetical protein